MESYLSQIYIMTKEVGITKGVYLVTSESVTSGHPDKFCDQISDAILDDVLSHDPSAHVAIETMATRGQVIIAGEITSDYTPDYEWIVHEVINGIGYDNVDLTGSIDDNLKIQVLVHEQSPEINQGVDQGDSILGAGDQGIMYGYATALDNTSHLLPLPYELAVSITSKLEHDRLLGIDTAKLFRCDGKSQVTVAYDEKTHKPLYVDAVVVSIQYVAGENNYESVDSSVRQYVKDILGNWYRDDVTRIYVNPTGAFTRGGPACDTGLTGRKLAVDTYGGLAHHGAGAFSGKDPTKVDRSGAYAARWVAKNIVASTVTPICEVSISYAIGRARPIHVRVDTMGHCSAKTERILEKIVSDVFDLTPSGIINSLRLRSTRYYPTASGGHFTSISYPWEDVSKAELIKDLYETYSS